LALEISPRIIKAERRRRREQSHLGFGAVEVIEGLARHALSAKGAERAIALFDPDFNGVRGGA
jgi:hypothetical protein